MGAWDVSTLNETHNYRRPIGLIVATHVMVWLLSLFSYTKIHLPKAKELSMMRRLVKLRPTLQRLLRYMLNYL